jgi:activating signal cointegrator complex subunit 3
LPVDVSQKGYDNPHVKAHLLFQAHFCRAELPIADYLTDTKSVLDQAIRILQAMVDIAANEGWLAAALRLMQLVQMVVQGRWVYDSSLLTLPNIERHHLPCFVHHKQPIDCIPELFAALEEKPSFLHDILSHVLARQQIDQVVDVVSRLPQLNVSIRLRTESLPCSRGKKAMSTTVTIDTSLQTKGPIRDWVSVAIDSECVLTVDLKRLNRPEKRYGYAPRFPKTKDEGWWLVLGDVEQQELIALKRLAFIKQRSTANLSFYTPEIPCRKIYTLYVMSDCYLGLDQQYDIHVEMTQTSDLEEASV